MDISSWVRLIAQAFPKLSGEGYEIVGESSKRYNCIAYAANDTNEWWDIIGERYWPDYAARTDRMESLIEVFTGLGYRQCQDSSLQDGFEKVALYEAQGVWKHAALQTLNGRWRSKMGPGPLIEHLSPESLADGIYGNPTIYMRRPAHHSSKPTR